MANPSWEDFRRTVAWAALGFWLLLALVPTIAVAVQAVRGDFTAGELHRMLLLLVPPTACYSVGAYNAIQIYRANNQARSRALTWRVVAAYAVGISIFLLTAALTR
ncbi:hypothetical protein Cs7R123_63760 [Catellatospora sp. TT07R-123]|nr:hypothetical protein Cs7R123_63760 [Catellatospora sp. TT07R-123]